MNSTVYTLSASYKDNRHEERAITCSLLAHIRNSGTHAKGPIDIFIPLIKRALSRMNSAPIFELDEGTRLRIVDFPATGESWAYFQYWRKVYKRKIRKEKIWSFIVNTGSILAFILTIFKLYEILSK